MLNGMDAAGEIQSLPPHLRLELGGNRKPQSGRLQTLRGEVQGLFAQDLVAEQALARERVHLCSDLNVAEEYRGRSPGSLFVGLQDVEVGGGTRLRVVVGVTRRYRRDPAGQLQQADHIDHSRMLVDGCG